MSHMLQRDREDNDCDDPNGDRKKKTSVECDSENGKIPIFMITIMMFIVFIITW